MKQELSNPLADGLYLVTRRIAEIGCIPTACAPWVLTRMTLSVFTTPRFLDRNDVEMMLSAGAIRVVPDIFWESIPSRAMILRRRRIVLTFTKAGTIRTDDRPPLRLWVGGVQ